MGDGAALGERRAARPSPAVGALPALLRAVRAADEGEDAEETDSRGTGERATILVASTQPSLAENTKLLVIMKDW